MIVRIWLALVERALHAITGGTLIVDVDATRQAMTDFAWEAFGIRLAFPEETTTEP
jgi:hypothetical protein